MRTTVKELKIEISAVSEKQKGYAESLANGFLVQFARLITDAQGKKTHIEETWLADAWNAKIEWLLKKWNEKIDIIKGMQAGEIIDKMKAGTFQHQIPFSIVKIEKKADEIFATKKKEIMDVNNQGGSMEEQNPWNMTSVDLAWTGSDVDRKIHSGMDVERALAEIKDEQELSDKDMDALRIYGKWPKKN